MPPVVVIAVVAHTRPGCIACIVCNAGIARIACNRRTDCNDEETFIDPQRHPRFRSRSPVPKQYALDSGPSRPCSFLSEIVRDGMSIYLTEHRGDCEVGGLVHLYVPDVDARYVEFEQQGVPIESPPSETIEGLRDMKLVDPDGNKLRIGTRLAPRPGNLP